MWARENGCPWDAKVCEKACLHGRIDMLKWARVFEAAWATRNEESMEYLRVNKCPGSED